MAGITQAQAEEKLRNYMEALDAVLLNQEHFIDGVKVTRANLKDIQDGINFWDAKVKTFDRGGIKVKYGVPE